MRAKKTTKPGIDAAVPSVRNVFGERSPPPLKGEPGKTAFENNWPAVEYGRRVMNLQSKDLQKIFISARVRKALKGQGYPLEDIESALTELGLD